MAALRLEIYSPVGRVRVFGTPSNELGLNVTFRGMNLTDSEIDTLQAAWPFLQRVAQRHYSIDVDYGALERQLGRSVKGLILDMDITAPRDLDLRATVNAGQLIVQDVHIAQALVLSSNAGEIRFRGGISGPGPHMLSNNAGRIIAEIEAGSSFELEATNDVGQLQVDLPLRERTEAGGVLNRRLTGLYGDGAPAGRLIISNNVGKIEISRAGGA